MIKSTMIKLRQLWKRRSWTWIQIPDQSIASCMSYRLLSDKETGVNRKQLHQTIYCLYRICRMKLLAWCCKCFSRNIQDSGKSEWLKQSQVLHLSNMKMMCSPPWPCRPFRVSKLLLRIRWLSLTPRSNQPFFLDVVFYFLPLFSALGHEDWGISFTWRFLELKYYDTNENILFETPMLIWILYQLGFFVHFLVCRIGCSIHLLFLFFLSIWLLASWICKQPWYFSSSFAQYVV